MSDSRWADWVPGTMRTGKSLNNFIAEAPAQGTRQPQQQQGPTPAEQAQQKGLTYAGYGYWRDNSGQVVAQTVEGELVMLDQNVDGVPTREGDPPTPATTDMGNPTSTVSGQTPASKAQSMGLISDGSGGYKDQQGNTVARTVNNELVFYDARGGGGAVSDGSGGALITQSSPSWVDPETGLIVVPPAQPESPEEVNATPDPTPAQAPAGYDAFVNRRKQEIYKQNYQEREVTQDIEQKKAAMEAAYTSSPAMQAIKEELDMIIADAMQGDERQQAVAVMVMAEMEEQAEELQNIFETVPEEEHEQLIDQILDYMVDNAKKTWFDENVKPEFKLDQPITDRLGRTVEYDKKGLRAAKADVSRGGTEDGYFRTGGLSTAQARRNYHKDKQAGMYMGDEDDGLGIDGDTIYSDNIQMDFFPRRPGALFAGKQAQRQEDLNDDIHEKAIEIGKQYGIRQAGGKEFQEVSWEPRKGVEAKTQEQRRQLAFEVLKTWRSKVLPKLQPGQILWNSPGNSQKARIYELAGFSREQDKYMGQFGLVVRDANGKNMIVPIDMDKKTPRLDENSRYLLDMIDLPLNEYHSTMIYEALF